MAWLDAERPSLVAAVGMAADTGRDQVALTCPSRWSSTLTGGGVSTTGWPPRHQPDAARRLGDRAEEGAALNNLGLVLQQVRRFEEAITAARTRRIFRETGDRHGEGMAVNNLGARLREAAAV